MRRSGLSFRRIRPPWTSPKPCRDRAWCWSSTTSGCVPGNEIPSMMREAFRTHKSAAMTEQRCRVRDMERSQPFEMLQSKNRSIRKTIQRAGLVLAARLCNVIRAHLRPLRDGQTQCGYTRVRSLPTSLSRRVALSLPRRPRPIEAQCCSLGLRSKTKMALL